MRTRSIDLAAYLHLSGIEPEEVRLDARFRVREFRYRGGEMLRAAVAAFNANGMVPVRAFAEARAEMKERSPRGGSKAVQHLRRAVEDATRQAEEET